MDDKILFRMLKSTPFFYELSSREFAEVAKEIKMHQFKGDTTIIREKEKGNSLFFVVYGVLRATIKNPENNKNILLSKFGIGNFLGEFSLLTGRLRTASVSTITDSELIEIPRDIYEKVAMKYPSVRRFLIDLCLQHQGHTAETLKNLKINRRQYPRLKLKGKIKFQEYKDEGGNKVIKIGNGALVDISESGLSFQVSRDAIDKDGSDMHDMYGKKYKAKIEVEGFHASIKELGKVVSFEIGITKRELADYYVVRMKFLKIDRNDKKTFRDLLSSLS